MQRNPVHEQQAAVAAAWQPGAPRIAVLLPCYNEEAAIGQVVRDFRAALPAATVYVYDNASSDRTGEVAAEAGATVVREPLRGKGNVVRRMFADIDADIYVLADGDDTYEAAAAPLLIEPGFPRWLLPIADNGSTMGIRSRIRLWAVTIGRDPLLIVLIGR